MGAEGMWEWVRPAAWGGTAALVLLPLAALRLADSNAWEAGDLMFALIMIGGVGLAFELAVRVRPSRAYAAGAAVAFVTGLLISWGNLAVGFVGSEDNPLNLIFFAAPLVALSGAMVARFGAAGMAVTTAAAAAAQLAAGAIALLLDAFTGPLTIFFTGLWLASAWLFRKSAHQQALA